MIARKAAKFANKFAKLVALALRRDEASKNSCVIDTAAPCPLCDDADQPQPLDLAHLAGFTLNRRSNEERLLRLFCDQAARDLERLRKAGTARDWQSAAHSMKSSAAAVGAWRLAQSAGAAMQLEPNGMDQQAATHLRELTAHLAQVNRIIALRLNVMPAPNDEMADGCNPRTHPRSPSKTG